jgi:hypothetical protein
MSRFHNVVDRSIDLFHPATLLGSHAGGKRAQWMALE